MNAVAGFFIGIAIGFFISGYIARNAVEILTNIDGTYWCEYKEIKYRLVEKKHEENEQHTP